MPRIDVGRKRCAIYTRKSSEEGLEQEFNSLAAQREACEAYIRSQQHEGWVLARTRYDDGGFSGGNLERPALQRLLADIRTGRIDIIVVSGFGRNAGKRRVAPSAAANASHAVISTHCSLTQFTPAR
jgi:DNA invertase Pin-like site-specific DNA recombinase